jgi:glycosyltransferase involved in cell wall biosynthesis
MIKVVIIETSGWGGIWHYTIALVQKLSQFTQLSLYTNCSLEFADWIEGIHIRKIFKRESYLLTLIKIIASLLHDRPQVVHFQSLVSRRKDVVLYLIIKILGIKIVTTIHNIFPHEIRPLEKKMYGWMYALSNKLILHGEKNKASFLEIFPHISASKLCVNPHGNYCLLRLKRNTQQEAKSILALPSADKVVLLIGAIRPYKGVDLFIECANAVLQALSSVSFVIVGQLISGTQEEYQKLVGNNPKISLSFKYLTLEEISLYMDAADIVAFPYKHIYQSGMVHLAMAHEKAIIASDVGAISEVVIHGESGVIVPANDMKRMTAAMISLLSDDKKRLQLGENGLKRAQTEFAWDKIAHSTEQIYLSLFN